MPKLSRPLLNDSLGATVFVFFLCWLLKLVVFNIEFLNPVESALHHVEEEFSNIVYDNTRASAGTAASTLCLVDVGTANRTEIARILNAIASQQPRLVAVDIVFDKKGMTVDTNLYLALKRLQQQKKLVMASWVSFKGEKGTETIKWHESNPPYKLEPTGYTNFVAEEVNGIVRHHLPQLGKETATKNSFLSFGAQVVAMADPKTWLDYGRHQAAMERYEPDWILYQNDQNLFNRFKADDLTRGNSRLAELTDKIVLVGTIKGDDNQYVSEDSHLVPLGDDVMMSGLEIHANIIAMLLDGTHLRKVANRIVWLIAFPVCWLLMIFLIRRSQQEGIWSEVIGKIVQIVTVVGIILIALLLFQFQHVQLSTLPLLVPIALTADALLIYGSFVRWLSSKGWLPYKSYFKISHAHTKTTGSVGRARVSNAPAHPRR